MSGPVLFYLTLGSALGAGLIAGVFFAFSSFIMPALTKLPPAEAIAAMQSINVVVLNRSFLSVFVGTAGLCLAVAVPSLFSFSTSGSKLRLAGAALYVLGTFLVTMACNVPLNDALANATPHATQAAETWSSYAPRWTAWNTVRALAALGAAASLILSLVQSASTD
ncbi:MAG TPA: anthrone oxygenase family protein [Polyangiaceae bacterium]|nr:anthrone oxygenase family protein [Polyangiaceae bacterium]